MRALQIALVIFIILALAGGAGSYYLYIQAQDIRKDAEDDREKIELLEEQVKDLKSAVKKSEKESRKTEEEEAEEPEGAKPTEERSDGGNTVVTAPLDGDVVGDPVTITGRAIAFENNINIRIMDGRGNILKETYATTDAREVGQFGNFSVTVNYADPSTPTGIIEVFQISARDGSEIDKVTIEVRFEE